MPKRGVRRFVFEVVFLAGVAAALTVADLRPAAVIVLMALAWVIVALLEWTAWLDEPHYGRGLPPRYYVPSVALPPPRPVEQPYIRYPVLHPPEDEPTFVASTQEWAAALHEWPVLESAQETRVEMPDDLAEGQTMVPLPPQIPELEQTVAAEPFFTEIIDDPELPEAPAEEEIRLAPVEAAAIAAVEAQPQPQPKRKPPARPDGEPVSIALPVRPPSTTLHRVDPLAGTGRRRFGFRRAAEVDMVEVHDGPPPGRMLPSRLRGGQ